MGSLLHLGCVDTTAGVLYLGCMDTMANVLHLRCVDTQLAMDCSHSYSNKQALAQRMLSHTEEAYYGRLFLL